MFIYKYDCFFLIQDGVTALMCAAENRHVDGIELLIHHGADVQIKEKVVLPYDVSVNMILYMADLTMLDA